MFSILSSTEQQSQNIWYWVIEKRKKWNSEALLNQDGNQFIILNRKCHSLILYSLIWTVCLGTEVHVSKISEAPLYIIDLLWLDSKLEILQEHTAYNKSQTLLSVLKIYIKYNSCKCSTWYFFYHHNIHLWSFQDWPLGGVCCWRHLATPQK